ncbi:NADH-quinone oxidoreductase subunit J [Odoribacter sp. OttesenSCG-928-J03]|nr:NADH-quinone oxidoreductase subunit J [Odoribacter sp. OttesenSCG-928-J03]MDL2282966.1 NADH-quinone oxidoreductase subunit J [Odoribacter sp. OttesenSCG-928-G04]
MESANLIVFYILGALIVGSSILAVTSKRMLRAATFLLFVLIGTAGLYLMLNYHFLAAVQLSVYAGGILILFIFAILLTSPKGDQTEPHDKRRMVIGVLTALAGVAITTIVTLKHQFLYSNNPTITGDEEINMKVIGHALMGTEKYQYLLPFEALSILLLACIIGGILIARKR